MIHPGSTVNKKVFEEMLERKTGRAKKLDPRVYDLSMTGSRLLLIRDDPDEEYGGVIIPTTVAIKDPPGAGWVIAVGPLVGSGSSPHPHGVRCDEADDMLYKHIIFGMYTGSAFTTNPTERGWHGLFWIMTDRDVWMVQDEVVNDTI